MDSEMNPIETARELATHASDIKHLQDDMDKLVKDMDEIKKAIQSIQRTLDEATGGRKVLFASISAAGVFGGSLTWLAEKLFFR
jgi:prefoldin subunit 5